MFYKTVTAHDEDVQAVMTASWSHACVMLWPLTTRSVLKTGITLMRLMLPRNEVLEKSTPI